MEISKEKAMRKLSIDRLPKHFNEGLFFREMGR